MHTLTIWAAQYLLWIMVLAIGAVWLFKERREGKVAFAVAAVIGLILALIFLYIAKSVHDDPRPFVKNPSIKPLFGHSTDDGFPSDHSVAAGLIAFLVLIRHRLTGLVLLLCAIAIAWARVAAHVHHLQDVLAGLILGGLAAGIATVLAPPVIKFVTERVPALSNKP
ncbi:MAG: phosphatase PAP2 family protein [Jatrophihabitantaceae bacterium]